MSGNPSTNQEMHIVRQIRREFSICRPSMPLECSIAYWQSSSSTARWQLMCRARQSANTVTLLLCVAAT